MIKFAKNIQKPLWIALLTLSVVLLSFSVFYYLTYSNLQKTTTITDDEAAVLEYMFRLDNIKGNSLAIESAERPIILAKRNDLVEDFKASVASDEIELAELKKLYKYDFLPVTEMKKYDQLIREKISFTQNIINLALSGNVKTAIKDLQDGESVAFEKSLKKQDLLLEDRGRKLLHQYQDMHDTDALKTKNQFLLLGACLFLFLVYALYRILKDANTNFKIAKDNKFFADIFNRVAEAVVIVDEKLAVIHYNAAAEKLFKRKRSDVFEKHISAAVGLKETNEMLAGMIKELNEKGTWAGELKNSYPDGTPLDVYASIAAIKNENGDVIAYSSTNLDFTEFKKNADNKNYLAKIFENSYDAIVGTDVNHNIKAWNKAAEAMFGFSLNEVIGKPVSDFLQIKPERRNEFRNAMATPELGYWKGDMDIINKDGKLIKTFFSIAAIKDENGISVDHVGVIKDISELATLQDELKILNESLQQQVEEKSGFINEILQRISDGFVSIDKQGNFTYVNQYIGTITGTDIDSLIGKNYLETFPPLKNTTFVQAFENAIKTQEPYHYEKFSEIWKVWLDINIYPSANGVSVFLRDITTRKEKDEQLFLKDTAIEGAINGIGMTDLDGNIIYANNSLVKMWGAKNKEELIGLKLTDVFAGPRVYKTIEALQTKGFDSGEDIGKRIDGSLFDVDFVANVIFDEAQKPLCLIGSFIDVTNRKIQTEEINKLASIIENSAALVGIISLDNKLLYLNSASKKILDIEANEDLSKIDPLSFFPTEERNKRLRIVFEKGFWYGENFLITKEKKRIPIMQYLLLHKNERGEPLYISSNAIDLSDLKQKQELIQKQSEALAVQNSKLEAIYNSIPSYLLEVDSECNILSLNKTRLGLTPADFIGHPFYKFLNNPQQADKIKLLIEDVFNKKITKQLEAELIDSDGKTFSYFGFVTPIVINNQVLSVLINVADISELKAKQSENQRLADIIDNSLAFTGIADFNANIIYCNKEMARVFGLDKVEKGTYNLSKLYTEKGKKTRDAALEVVKEKGRWQGENEMISIDGKVIPIYQTILAHYDESGKLQNTSTTAVNITELKAKQHENDRLLSMMENSAAIVGIINMEGNIQYANKTLRKNLEVEDGEDIGNYNINLFRTKDGESKIEAIRKELFVTGSWVGENFYHSKSGKEYTLYQVMLLHKDVDGKPVYISTTAIDITDLKKKQEESDLYLSVLNNSTAYFSIADENLNMVYANQSLKEALELDKDVTSYQVKDFASKKSTPTFSNPNHPIHKEKKWIGENYYASLSGKEIPVLQVIMLHEFDGKVKYVSSTSINISEIKEKEREKDRLIQLINTSPAFFAMTDLNRNGLFANETVRKELGIEEDRNISTINFDEFRNDKGNDIIKQIHDELFKSGSWMGENYYVTKQGKEIPVMQVMHLHKEKDNETAYISSTAIDISKAKEDEKELAKLAGIIENSKALVLIVDLNFNILYLNKAAKERFEIEEHEDITKLRGLDFVPDETKELMKVEEAKFFSEGKWVGELNFKSRSGKLIPVLEVGILHKDHNGIPQYMSFTLVDISEQKEAEKELIRLNSELRELSNHLQDIREEERSEIAREIHDVLGQNLTVLKMAASWIKKHIHDNPTGAERRLEELMDVTDETIQSSRKLYNALHPNMLDDIGLVAAIQWHANTFTKATGIDIEVFSNFSHKILSSKLRLGLYRIYQESLTNILRHANASHVMVNLTKEDQAIIMSVSDNGDGFDTTKVDILHSHGLLGMRERVYAMSGKLNIKTEIDKGTLVEVVIPFAKEIEGPENFENVI